jgi:uncharacterized protein (DUF433 family)
MLALADDTMSAMTPATNEKVHVTKSPGVCGGKACIAGSRIRVQDIYQWHALQGMSPDEILRGCFKTTFDTVGTA